MGWRQIINVGFKTLILLYFIVYGLATPPIINEFINKNRVWKSNLNMIKWSNMELIIVIALVLIVYAVWDINTRVKRYMEYKNTFDPDYPYYTAIDLQIAQIEMDVAREEFNKKNVIYEEYWEKNKQELLKVKKNADHSKEFKDIMHDYHYYADSLNDKADYFHQMIEVNYAIRNGKKTYKQASEEIRGFILRIKKSGYHEWLKYESKS